MTSEGSFKPVHMGPSKIAEALVSGIRAAIMTAILLTAIGIMNNAIVTSGVGNSFSLMIAQWSQGSLALAIVLIAIASLVLGMGLPVTAAYIILAILTAPALAGLMADGVIVEQLMAGITDPAQSALFFLVDHPLAAQVATGMTKAEAWELVRNIPFEVAVTIRPVMVDPALQTTFLLTAHLIIFWLSQDRLYIVPLLFAYTPLISGEFTEVLQIGFFALFGIYATNALIQWYAEGPIGIVTASLLVLGAIGAYWPLSLFHNIAGAGIVLGVIIWTSRERSKMFGKIENSGV